MVHPEHVLLQIIKAERKDVDQTMIRKAVESDLDAVERIYDESKQRPQYIIKKTINIDSENN